MSLYRRVGEIQEIEELGFFKEEMINRFGIIPDEFSNYLNVMVLKLLARKCSIAKIYVFKILIPLLLIKDVLNILKVL